MERRVTLATVCSVSGGCVAVGLMVALASPALQVGELPVAHHNETIIYPSTPIRISKLDTSVHTEAPRPVVKTRPETPREWKPVSLPPLPAKLPAPDETAAVPKVRPAAEPSLVEQKLKRYCSRPGKTERSWIRARGRKFYCPA